MISRSFFLEALVSGISLCTPPITLNVDQAGDMIRPQVERRALLDAEIVLLVDAEQPVTAGAAVASTASITRSCTPSRCMPDAMVRRRSWVRHSGMAARLSSAALLFEKPRHRALAVSAEDVGTEARDGAEDVEGNGGEGDRVLLAALGAIAGELDHVILDLRPAKLGNLGQPCARQDEKLIHGPEGVAEGAGGVPHLAELGIAELASADILGAMLGQIRHRIRGDEAAAYGPAKQAMQMGMNSPRHDRRSAIRDDIQQLDHVAPADVLDRRRSPPRQDVLDRECA